MVDKKKNHRHRRICRSVLHTEKIQDNVKYVKMVQFYNERYDCIVLQF